MTFKYLKKRVSLELPQQQSTFFRRLHTKPFWIWNVEEHKQEDVKTNGYCCFDSLVAHNGNKKHLWIKKATALGISEFMLRFMAWLCFKDKIAINPDKFDKLITSIRTAFDNDGTLDKEATSYNDIFDAFRLALKFYHFEERDS